MLSHPSQYQARFDFRLESVHNGLACGWVRDRRNPDRRLHVSLLVDGELFTDWADINRDDLKRADCPQADCGFRIEFGRHEFKNIALLVEGECLYAEVAAPGAVPAAPPALDETEVAALFAPGWQERPLLALFADQSWDVHPGRARNLARALAASDWDVAYIEPAFRNMRGMRASALEEGRICRIALPAFPHQTDLSRAYLEPGLCQHWKAMLRKLAEGRPRCASLYAGARWISLMQTRPLEGPCVLDLDHDPCSLSPWQLPLALLQSAIAAADRVTLASPALAAKFAGELAGCRPGIILRNGFHRELLPLACPALERRYFFGASAVLERSAGARWVRDFLQAHPGLPAVVVGGGTLEPMFSHLAQTQPGISFLGAASALVAAYCLSRSRFSLIPASAAAAVSPCAFYESLALGVPSLGPHVPDCEDELRAAFTAVAAEAVDLSQLRAAQGRFDALRADLDLERYSWDARAKQLLHALQASDRLVADCAPRALR